MMGVKDIKQLAQSMEREIYGMTDGPMFSSILTADPEPYLG